MTTKTVWRKTSWWQVW